MLEIQQNKSKKKRVRGIRTSSFEIIAQPLRFSRLLLMLQQLILSSFSIALLRVRVSPTKVGLPELFLEVLFGEKHPQMMNYPGIHHLHLMLSRGSQRYKREGSIKSTVQRYRVGSWKKETRQRKMGTTKMVYALRTSNLDSKTRKQYVIGKL